MSDLILAVNPRATSTEVGLFRGGEPLRRQIYRSGEEDILPYRRFSDHLAFRVRLVRTFLAEEGIARGGLSAVAACGGRLRPVESGTYLVEETLLRDAARADPLEHAENLGGPVAAAVGRELCCPAYVVDPATVDELEPVARVSGLEGVERRSLCRALPIRTAARRHARAAGRPLNALNLVVAHMGKEVSLAALRHGRMIDAVSPDDEGPFGAESAGGIPAAALVGMCFAPGASEAAVRRRLLCEGGLGSHLGTRDVAEAVARSERDDARALLVLQAMAYQVAKGVGAMATVLAGDVDAIVLTGGAAEATHLVLEICRRSEWIAPVFVYPGEDDLASLAEGVRRVLTGEERARVYGAC